MEVEDGDGVLSPPRPAPASGAAGLYRPRAWILSIGNELLIGRIVNTNAAWLAERLTLLGATVRRIITVPDELDDIAVAVRRAAAAAEIVVTTGGLGPTDDDMTMEAVAAGLGKPLVLDKEALRMVEEFYRRRGLPLTPERAKMARLPVGARPIPNPVGAAPGAHVWAGRTQLFILPGVPNEMRAMFETYVAKALEPYLPPICVRELGKTYHGIPESTLAPLLRKASRLCSDCYVKSHPRGHEVNKPVVEVRVLASGESCREAEGKARRVLEELDRLLRGGES